MCEYVVYKIEELFSFHKLKYLQNHIVYRRERDVTDVILVNIFYNLV
jgi:hypothetical protein